MLRAHLLGLGLKFNQPTNQPTNQRNGDGTKQEKTGTQGSIQDSEHNISTSDDKRGRVVEIIST